MEHFLIFHNIDGFISSEFCKFLTQLLVEWTQGKNLIVSSAAPSVLELRGPNDVANLLSLLGLSNECAKATISKNCRFVFFGNLDSCFLFPLR